MINNQITIEIQYIVQNNQNLQSFFLYPFEYFDLEEDEQIDLDCCPKFNHAFEYINNNHSNFKDEYKNILFTKLLLTDLKHKKHRQITERFWSNGKNKIIERIDLDLTRFKIIFKEIIIETLVTENPPTWEIIRLNQEDGIMLPIFHSFIEEKENGEQIEQEKIIESLPLINTVNQQYILT